MLTGLQLHSVCLQTCAHINVKACVLLIVDSKATLSTQEVALIKVLFLSPTPFQGAWWTFAVCLPGFIHAFLLAFLPTVD